MCPNLKCISIMMSFLKYITGFFMNFELLTDWGTIKHFFFASLFWKGVKISHIWKLYRIFHSILIIFFVVEWIVSSMVCWRISSIFYGIFSSPGQRQCELLPSLDVRRLKPLSQMNWNLVGSIYGKSSLKIAHFVPIY